MKNMKINSSKEKQNAKPKTKNTFLSIHFWVKKIVIGVGENAREMKCKMKIHWWNGMSWKRIMKKKKKENGNDERKK